MMNVTNCAAKGVAVSIAAAAIYAASPAAAFVDGKIDAGEYTSAFELHDPIPDVNGFLSAQGPSKLFLRQTTDHLFVCISIDINYEDNVYGDDKLTSPLSTVGSGWEHKTHKLSELASSDDL